MARFLSSTDLAIAVAVKAGTIFLTERPSRLGGTFVAISDDVGLIEVHNTADEANARISAILEAVR